MRLGLHALGIGSGADRAVIDAVAAAAERAGFATLWSGEHVVMVDESASRYPYSDDGQIAVPAEADWIDPMIGLSFAAAATSTIGIATGVLLLPEHNPVLVAKQAATLDTLSGGRLTLGVGIGWSREEFDALGVPFERRGRAHQGVRRRHAHIVARRRRLVRRRVRQLRLGAGQPETRCATAAFRSCSAATATRRCAGSAAWGDGWYGFNLDSVDAVAERVEFLRAAVSRAVAAIPPNSGWPSRFATSSVPTSAPLASSGHRRIGDRRGSAGGRRAAADWVSALADRWMPEIMDNQ